MNRTDTRPINYTFNARKSSDHATPKWNNRIYLMLKVVENKTHVSTSHGMIRKQLSIKVKPLCDMSTPRPLGAQTPLRHSDLNCIRLIIAWYPTLGISKCHIEPETVDLNHDNLKTTEFELGSPEWVCILEYGMVITLDHIFLFQSIQFVSKWPYPKSDQSTWNTLFTMTTSQRACKPVMMTRAFSRRNQHRAKALCWKSVSRMKVLTMLGYRPNQQMLPI